MNENDLQYAIRDYPFTCKECGKHFRSSVTEEDIVDGVLLSEYHICEECLTKKVDITKLLPQQ